MKRSKFTDAQIAFILQQANEGTSVAEVCRKASIAEATFYSWRKKYAGLMPSEMKRLKQLEEENGKLKRLVADLSLDKVMLQDVIKRKLGLRAVTVGARSEAADENLVTVSPGQWLGYVKNASAVVTNSFHGTIFSIKQQRPFFVVPHKSGSMRLVDLLERAGLPERMLPAEVSEASLPENLLEVEFDSVHARLADAIKQSQAFLESAAKQAEQAG